MQYQTSTDASKLDEVRSLLQGAGITAEIQVQGTRLVIVSHDEDIIAHARELLREKTGIH